MWQVRRSQRQQVVSDGKGLGRRWGWDMEVVEVRHRSLKYPGVPSGGQFRWHWEGERRPPCAGRDRDPRYHEHSTPAFERQSACPFRTSRKSALRSPCPRASRSRQSICLCSTSRRRYVNMRLTRLVPCHGSWWKSLMPLTFLKKEQKQPGQRPYNSEVWHGEKKHKQ